MSPCLLSGASLSPPALRVCDPAQALCWQILQTWLTSIKIPIVVIISERGEHFDHYKPLCHRVDWTFTRVWSGGFDNMTQSKTSAWILSTSVNSHVYFISQKIYDCNEGQQHPSNWRQYHFELTTFYFLHHVYLPKTGYHGTNKFWWISFKKGSLKYLRNILCRKLIQAKKKKKKKINWY